MAFLAKLEAVPKNQRLVLFIMILVLPLVLYYFLIFSPLGTEVNSLDKKLQELKQTLTKNRQLARLWPRLQREVATLDVQLNQALTQLPESKEIPELLAQIVRLSLDAGLEVWTFQPQPELAKGFYAEVPVRIKVSGDFWKVSRFFAAIGRLPRIVNVSEFKMSRGGGEPGATSPAGAAGAKLLQTEGITTTFRFIKGAKVEAEAKDKDKGKKEKGKKEKD